MKAEDMLSLWKAERERLTNQVNRYDLDIDELQVTLQQTRIKRIITLKAWEHCTNQIEDLEATINVKEE